MLRDFYFRKEDDVNYTPDVMEISSEQEELVYQVKMILLTNKTEVLGESQFGANQEDMLFTTSDFDGSMLARNLVDQINQYSEIARVFNLGITAKRMVDPNNAYKDVMLLDVTVKGKSAFGVIV